MPYAPLLSEPEIVAALAAVPNWTREDATLVRTFEHPSFRATIDLLVREDGRERFRRRWERAIPRDLM